MTKYCNLRDICLRNFIIANKVLLRGANLGLTLYEIGCILYRDGDDEVTVIQQLIDKTGSYIEAVFGQGKQLAKSIGIFRICFKQLFLEEEETEDDFETLNLNKKLNFIKNGFNNLENNYIHSK